MNKKWIEISKIKLSNEKMICTKDLIICNNNVQSTPLLVDETFNLIDNYNEYFVYLINKNQMVPVIISSVMDNFYINDFLQAA
jgi:hypothetical protein